MKRLACALSFGLWLAGAAANAAPAAAAPSTQWEFYPLNVQARFETGEQQSLAPRTTLGLAMGARLGRQSLLLELSSFTARTGSDFAGIDRRHEEMLMWLRTDLAANRRWAAVAGGGLGVMRETARTRIDSLRTDDESGLEPLGAVSLAGLFKTKTLRLSLEGRLFFGPALEPSPQPDVVFRTGFAF